MSSHPSNDTKPLAQSASPVADGRSVGRSSYGQILKSSVLIGGTSLINIGIGIVRTKAMALLLGPSGFGLMGLYQSILNFSQSLAGMGINGSGVRQIAAAVGSGDTERIAQTVTVLRRTAVALGVLGTLLLLVFSRQVSVLTFGSDAHAGDVAILSLAMFCGSVAGGQGALIQGMRRIGDLAKMSVLGAIVGTAFSIPLVYFFREKGVAVSLVVLSAMGILISWWYSRRIQVRPQPLKTSEVVREAGALLKLGSAFMASGMLIMGAAYVIRIIIVRSIGFEAAGLYQSAWTLGGLYIGFILQAMSADFYPRLTASVNDHPECNRLVNEQAQISLLLAGPGVIATLTFAPLVIAVLYSAQFSAAVVVLRWVCLGAALQVITWPMGFIVVAKDRPALFFVCELAYTAVYLALAWFLIKSFGLNGAGMAFFGSYVFHALLIYPIVARLSGFRWTAVNRQIGLVFLTLIGLAFVGFYVLPFWLATVLGSLALALNAVYSLRTLSRLVPHERLPGPLKRLLVWVRLAPAVEACPTSPRA